MIPAEDAAGTLARIASGEIQRCILPWIPLMRGGGKRGIIEEWKKEATAEPQPQLRETYAGLALVFAELAGRKRAWRDSFKGWNMRESAIANEWRTEGLVEAKRADVLRLFELRFRQAPPERLETFINRESDLEKLSRWFEAAATAESAGDFLAGAGI